MALPKTAEFTHSAHTQGAEKFLCSGGAFEPTLQTPLPPQKR